MLVKLLRLFRRRPDIPSGPCDARHQGRDGVYRGCVRPRGHPIGIGHPDEWHCDGRGEGWRSVQESIQARYGWRKFGLVGMRRDDNNA